MSPGLGSNGAVVSRPRDQMLDFLRFLGLCIVMTAHADPPALLFQLRNFGSPLLIVASAMTIATIYRTRPIEAGAFIRRRLGRLIFAVWSFLCVFFVLMYLASALTGRAFAFDSRTILGSFTFYNGIGYVWIFKVYITLALITPLALWFKNRIRSRRGYFLVLALAYAAYELALPFMRGQVPAGSAAFMDTAVFVIVPYSLLFLYGLRLGEADKRAVLLTSIVAGVIFAVMAVAKYQEAGVFVGTQFFKYPPTLYYLSYAVMSLNLVYLASARFMGGRLNPTAVTWLSSKSLWIYLWHILGIYVWDAALSSAAGWPLIFLAKGTFILTFGVACTLLQTRLVERLAAAVPDLPGRGLVAVLR